jgi:hypothetical protein
MLPPFHCYTSPTKHCVHYKEFNFRDEPYCVYHKQTITPQMICIYYQEEI